MDLKKEVMNFENEKKKCYLMYRITIIVNIAIFTFVACCILYGNNLFRILIFTIIL